MGAASALLHLCACMAMHTSCSHFMQACLVRLDGNGMEVRWEDDSKALQSLVFMRPEVRGCSNGEVDELCSWWW